MIIYIEKDALNYTQTNKIISLFPEATKIIIKNYKNIFDKNIPLHQEKCIVIAKITGSAIGKTPDNYGHTPNTYFFKTSINCVFDCSYCYLKGAFKNDMQVYFVNYDEIKKDISEVIEKDKNPMRFYSSDYSDILGSNKISGFLQEFVPFFEKFDNVMMEVRTKSTCIQDIIDLGFVPKNTEFAFSLNPQILIDKYEKGTPCLDDRIKAINKLLEQGYKVGLRFLPLLPVKNYEQIYTEFVEYIKKNIDIKKLHSSFAAGLLYTKEDYNKILKKYPRLDILHKLKLEKDDFVRCDREERDFFYKIFKDLDKNCKICMDE
ncbi:hypothetical protein EOM39_01930 [Candidatus Gracilibacteria bacterium]|nr:hypothetical protein [Candidatus Gracilibacteria bacterium]